MNSSNRGLKDNRDFKYKNIDFSSNQEITSFFDFELQFRNDRNSLGIPHSVFKAFLTVWKYENSITESNLGDDD